MAQTNPTPATALGTPPNTSAPSTFSVLMDALLGALPNLVTQFNALATNCYNNAVDAFNNATSGAASAASAANSAATAAATVVTGGVTAWAAATPYAIGNCAFSLIDFQTYRRRVAGTTATDPISDPTNWVMLLYARAWQTKTVAYNVVSGDRLFIDTLTTGAVALTMPAAPLDGDQCEIMDLKSNFDITNCSLLGNGKTVMGVTTLNLNIKNLHRTFTYSAALGDWRI